MLLKRKYSNYYDRRYRDLKRKVKHKNIVLTEGYNLQQSIDGKIKYIWNLIGSNRMKMCSQGSVYEWSVLSYSSKDFIQVFANYFSSMFGKPQFTDNS